MLTKFVDSKSSFCNEFLKLNAVNESTVADIQGFLDNRPAVEDIVIVVKKLISLLFSLKNHQSLKETLATCSICCANCIDYIKNQSCPLDSKSEWDQAFLMYYYFELKSILENEFWDLFDDGIMHANSCLSVLYDNYDCTTSHTAEILDRTHNFTWQYLGKITEKGTKFVKLEQSASIALVSLRVLSCKDIDGFSSACKRCAQLYQNLDKKTNQMKNVHELFWKPCCRLLISTSTLFSSKTNFKQNECAFALASAWLLIVAQLLALEEWETSLNELELLEQYLITAEKEHKLSFPLAFHTTILISDIKTLYAVITGDEPTIHHNPSFTPFEKWQDPGVSSFLESLKNVIRVSTMVFFATLSGNKWTRSLSSGSLLHIQEVMLNYFTFFKNIKIKKIDGSHDCGCYFLIILINSVKTFAVQNTDVPESIKTVNNAEIIIDLLLNHCTDVTKSKSMECVRRLCKLETSLSNIAGVLSNNMVIGLSVQLFEKLAENYHMFRALHGRNEYLWKNYRCLSYLYKMEDNWQASLQACVRGLIVEPGEIDKLLQTWVKIKFYISKKVPHHEVLKLSIVDFLREMPVVEGDRCDISDVHLLQLEISAYLDQKKGLCKSCIESVVNQLLSMKLSVEDRLWALISKCRYIWQFFEDACFEELNLTVVELNKLCDKLKEPSSEEKLLMYKGIAHYWEYMSEKLKLVRIIKREMNMADIIPLKQNHPPPGEEDLDGDLPIHGAYRSLKIAKEIELMDKMKKCINYWERIKLKALSKDERSLLLMFVLDCGYISSCHGHYQLACRLWQWIRSTAESQEGLEEFYIDCLKELAMYDPTTALIADIKALLPFVTNIVFRFKLNIGLAYCYLKTSQYRDGMLVLAELFCSSKQIDWDFDIYVLKSELYLLSSHYSCVPCLDWKFYNMLNAGPKFFSTESKVMILSIFNQPDRIKELNCGAYHHLLKVMLETSLNLGEMCINMGAYQESLVFMKQEVILAQKNLFAQRTTNLVNKLLEVDLMCGNFDDALVKINGMLHIFKEIMDEKDSCLKIKNILNTKIGQVSTNNLEVERCVGETLRTDDPVAGSPVVSPIIIFQSGKKRLPRKTAGESKKTQVSLPVKRSTRSQKTVKKSSGQHNTPIVINSVQASNLGKCNAPRRKKLFVYQDVQVKSPVTDFVSMLISPDIPAFFNHSSTCHCSYCYNPHLIAAFLHFLRCVARYYALTGKFKQSVSTFKKALEVYRLSDRILNSCPVSFSWEIKYQYADCLYWLLKHHSQVTRHEDLLEQYSELAMEGLSHQWMSLHMHVKSIELNQQVEK